ncbi:MAG: polysaccharide deacetylase family protein [Treponema sp.]|nr:polysaccharide deacetylase family protein [Treponema sp.]
MLILLLAGIVLSCASRPPAIVDAETALPPDPPPAAAPEKIPEAVPDPLTLAVRKIQANSPAVRKYWRFDADSGITVKGDLADDAGEFEVDYDLKNALPADDGGYDIPFSVRDRQNGAGREGRFFWTAGEDAAGLLLSCDDDYRKSWEDHYDLMDRYGARVTFFVQGSLSHEGGEALAAFCREAMRRGHDIGFHTVHHLNLTKVSRNAFHWETVSAAEEFVKAGIPLTAFAYPYGFQEPWMRDALSSAFRILRGYGANFRLYDAEAITAGNIVSKAIDNIIYRNDGDFEREIALMLLAAKFIGGNSVVPFTTHDISDSADWGIKPRRLEYLLKTAQYLNLRFYRYCDF